MAGKAPLLESSVVDVALQPSQPAAVTVQEDSSIEMFERLARDPNTSVEKIAGLMALWERMQAKKAESAFNEAMSAAQADMRPVSADAYNPQTKSNYASYEALDRALRPIYVKHGFGLSFNTVDSPHAEHVRVICKATHAGGHSELYRLDMPADGKGAKGGDVMTKTHATGSALTYGQRYLLKMIFNVAIGEGTDDDGNKAATPKPKGPAGFDDWWADIQATADTGLPALDKAWTASKGPFKQHVRDHYPREWEAVKGRAAQVRG